MGKKLIFPLSIFQYAVHGVGYILSIFAKKEPEDKTMRLEGDRLDMELAKVKKESAGFRQNEALEDKQVEVKA